MTCQFNFQNGNFYDNLKQKYDILNFFCLNTCKYSEFFFKSEKCFKNLVKSLWEIKNDKRLIINFFQPDLKYYLNLKSSKILLNLSSIIKEILLNKKYSYNFLLSCEKNNCSIKNSIIHLLGNEIFDGLILKNPIIFYMNLNSFLVNFKEVDLSKNCYSCNERIMVILKRIKENFEKSDLIKIYLKNRYGSNRLEITDFYQIIFNPQVLEQKNLIINDFEKKDSDLLDYYKIGPYEIKILKNDFSNENKDLIKQSHVIDINIENMASNLDTFSELSIKFFKFNDILKFKKSQIKNHIYSKNLNIIDHDIDDFVDLLTYKSLGLNNIFPFLLDNNIEEFYLDRPNSYIYLDHSKYGRCQSNILIEHKEIQNFITKIRAENNINIDLENPIIKTEIITDYFHIRISINYKPLAVDDINFSIRKFNNKKLSMFDLLNNNTISINALTYLMYFLIHKRNILIIGEPGSGKTTLMNAIDLLCPSFWRKIYLEDVIESIPQIELGKHQTRLKVKEPSNQKYSKQFQVRESLHRTPDIVIIGELIHTETIKALFFLLKVGLQCTLGTCHGTNPELIIERWKEDDGISPVSIGNLDIIIHIGKTSKGRRILRISEISKKEINDKIKIKIQNIFEREPISDKLIFKFRNFDELYEKSYIIKKINLDFKEFIKIDNFRKNYLKINNFFKSTIKNKFEFNKELIESIDKFWKDIE